MLAVVLATNLSPTFGATGSYAQANIGMALGIVVGILLYWKRLGSKLKVINEGFSRCSVILPVCAAVAFGTVVKSTAAFQGLCDWLLTLDMSPLVSLAIQCNVFTAAMGSGTGRHCPDARDVWADLCGYGTESGGRGPCDGDFLPGI